MSSQLLAPNRSQSKSRRRWVRPCFQRMPRKVAVRACKVKQEVYLRRAHNSSAGNGGTVAVRRRVARDCTHSVHLRRIAQLLQTRFYAPLLLSRRVFAGCGITS